jgi:hypothetical protein
LLVSTRRPHHEFEDESQSDLQTLSFESNLVGAEELDPVMCSNEVVSFSKTAVVELEICDQLGMIDDDLDALEDAFVSLFRTLETTTVNRQGNFTLKGNLPLRLRSLANAWVATQKRSAYTVYQPSQYPPIDCWPRILIIFADGWPWIPAIAPLTHWQTVHLPRMSSLKLTMLVY